MLQPYEALFLTMQVVRPHAERSRPTSVRWFDGVMGSGSGVGVLRRLVRLCLPLTRHLTARDFQVTSKGYVVLWVALLGGRNVARLRHALIEAVVARWAMAFVVERATTFIAATERSLLAATRWHHALQA